LFTLLMNILSHNFYYQYYFKFLLHICNLLTLNVFESFIC